MAQIGTNAQVSFVDETVWASGTPSMTTAVPFLSESLKKDRAIVASDAIDGTNQRSIWREGLNTVAGDLSIEVYPEGVGKLFKHALGRIFSAGPSGTSNYYVHRILPSGSLPAGLRVEVARDAQTWQYNGMKVNQMTLSCAIGEPLTATFSFLGYNESDATKTTGLTLTTLSPFTYDEGKCYLDGSATETEITGFTITVNNMLADSKGKLGSKFRVEIPKSGFMEVTGTLNMEFDDKTVYNKFINQTETAIQLKFTSDSTFGAGATAYDFQIDMPRCIYTGETPNISGPDVIYHDMPFIAFYYTSGGDQEKDSIRMRLVNSEASY